MKTIKVLGSFLIASSAHAELALSQNNFWHGFFNNQANLYVVPADKNDLLKACESYKKSIYSDSQLIDKDDLNERRRIGQGYFDSFVANGKFFVDITRSEADSQNSLGLAQQASDSDPRSKQFGAVRFGRLENLTAGMAGDLHVVANKNSLTAISYKVGLVPLPVTLVENSDRTLVKFSGFDSACDFLDGNATLQFESHASLLLDTESAQAISNFYQRLSDSALSVLRTKYSLRRKAALLGFSVGALYQESAGLDESFANERIGIFVDQFLNEQLIPNALWRRQLNGEVLGLNVPMRQVEKILVEVRYTP